MRRVAVIIVALAVAGLVGWRTAEVIRTRQAQSAPAGPARARAVAVRAGHHHDARLLRWRGDGPRPRGRRLPNRRDCGRDPRAGRRSGPEGSGRGAIGSEGTAVPG